MLRFVEYYLDEYWNTIALVFENGVLAECVKIEPCTHGVSNVEASPSCEQPFETLSAACKSVLPNAHEQLIVANMFLTIKYLPCAKCFAKIYKLIESLLDCFKDKIQFQCVFQFASFGSSETKKYKDIHDLQSLGSFRINISLIEWDKLCADILDTRLFGQTPEDQNEDQGKKKSHQNDTQT